MLRKCLRLALLVLLVSLAPTTRAQTILNGDFENNSSTGCDFNLPNADYTAKMDDSAAFLGSILGNGEICIMEGDCGFSSPPQSGTTKIAIATCNQNPEFVDAFSLGLSSPLVPGTSYELCFHAEANTQFSDGSISNIQLGESTSPIDFGSLIGTVTPSTGGWTHHCLAFTATTSGQHITAKNTEFVRGWNHLDNFTLEAVSAVPTTSRIGLIALGVFLTLALVGLVTKLRCC